MSLFLADRDGNGEILCLKAHPRARAVAQPSAALRILREKCALQLLALLPHPMITAFRGAYIDFHIGDHLYIAMEHVGAGVP